MTGTTATPIGDQARSAAAAQVSKLPEVQSVSIQGNDVHVRVANGGESASRIAAHLEPVGVIVQGIIVITPALEDVFISLIGDTQVF